MAAVTEHYATHLGPVYAWMAGGVEAAIARGAKEIETLGLLPRLTGQAVDLGAGFGMHSIPLARRGFSVLAIDSCGELLQTLRQEAAPWPGRGCLAANLPGRFPSDHFDLGSGCG